MIGWLQFYGCRHNSPVPGYDTFPALFVDLFVTLARTIDEKIGRALGADPELTVYVPECTVFWNHVKAVASFAGAILSVAPDGCSLVNQTN